MEKIQGAGDNRGCFGVLGKRGAMGRGGAELPICCMPRTAEGGRRPGCCCVRENEQGRRRERGATSMGKKGATTGHHGKGKWRSAMGDGRPPARAQTQ
jgi:hypothetical protein